MRPHLFIKLQRLQPVYSHPFSWYHFADFFASETTNATLLSFIIKKPRKWRVTKAVVMAANIRPPFVSARYWLIISKPDSSKIRG